MPKPSAPHHKGSRPPRDAKRQEKEPRAPAVPTKRRAEQDESEKQGVKRVELFFGTKSERRAKYKEYKSQQDPLYPLQDAIVAKWERLRSRHSTKEEKNEILREIDKICGEWKQEGVVEPIWKFMRRPVASRVLTDCVKLGFIEPHGKSKEESVSCTLIPNIVTTLLRHLFEAATDRYAHHILEELIYRVNVHTFPRQVEIPEGAGMKGAKLAEYVRNYTPEPLYGINTKNLSQNGNDKETMEENGESQQLSKRALQRQKREEREKEKSKPIDYILIQIAVGLVPYFYTLSRNTYSIETTEALYAKADFISMLCNKDLGEIPETINKEGLKSFTFSLKQKLLIQSVLKRPVFKTMYAPKEEVDAGRFIKPDEKENNKEKEKKVWKREEYPDGSVEQLLAKSYDRNVPLQFVSNKLRNIFTAYLIYCKYNPKTYKNKKRTKEAITTDDMLKINQTSMKSFNTFELLLAGIENKFTQATDFDDADIISSDEIGGIEGGEEPFMGEEEEEDFEEGDQEFDNDNQAIKNDAGAPDVTGISSKLKRHQMKAVKQLTSPLFQDIMATGAVLTVYSMTHIELEDIKQVKDNSKKANNTIFTSTTEKDASIFEDNRRKIEMAVKSAEFYKVLADPFIKNQKLVTYLLDHQGGVVFLYNMMNIDQDGLSDLLNTQLSSTTSTATAEKAESADKKKGDEEEETTQSLKASLSSFIIKLRLKVLREFTAPLNDTDEPSGLGECILYQIISKFQPLTSKVRHGPPVKHFPEPALLIPLLLQTSDAKQLARLGLGKKEHPMWLLYALGSLGNSVVLEMLDKNSSVWVDWLCGKLVKIFRSGCMICDVKEKSEQAVNRYENARKVLAKTIASIKDSDVFDEENKEGSSHPLYSLVKDVAKLVSGETAAEKETKSKSKSKKAVPAKTDKKKVVKKAAKKSKQPKAKGIAGK